MSIDRKKNIEIKRNRRQIEKICANCGLQLFMENKFCPQCGQKFRDLNVSISHLFGEAIEGFLHFDNKSFQTVWKLIRCPGFLTSEFIKGRRVRYVAPVRLYILISFIFFLLLGLPDRKSGVPEKNGFSDFSISFYGINSSDIREFTPAQLDSVLQKKDIKPTAFNKYLINQLKRIGTGGKGEFGNLLMKAVSYMMFALMPVFAMFVYLLHRKNMIRYIGALIFSVHLHCFMFIVSIFYLLLDRFIGISEYLILVPLIFPIYLYSAFRQVYGDSRIRALLKILVVGPLQAASILILLILTILVSLLLF
jgi:hypothetical protein